jgi:hypothetical protein
MNEKVTMKIVKTDDKSTAACQTCKKIADVTYRLRDVPLSDGSDVVKDVLVGVCDICDNVCVLPHQSVPKVAKTMERHRKPVDSRVPAHMLDILNLASAEVGGGSDFVPNLMKYYLHALAVKEISSGHLARYLTSDLASGKSQKRISLKGRRVLEDIEKVKKLTNLSSTSDIVKSVILKINDDILQNKSKRPIKALEGIAAACQ